MSYLLNIHESFKSFSQEQLGKDAKDQIHELLKSKIFVENLKYLVNNHCQFVDRSTFVNDKTKSLKIKGCAKKNLRNHNRISIIEHSSSAFLQKIA